MADHPEKCLEVPFPVKLTATMRRQMFAAAEYEGIEAGTYIKKLITADLEAKQAEARALQSIFVDPTA